MSIQGVLTDAGRKAMGRGWAGLIKNVASYFVVGEGGANSVNVPSETGATGNGVLKNFSFTISQVPIVRGSVTIVAGAVTGTDNGNGNISGAGVSGSINYKTGLVNITYTVAVPNLTAIVVSYHYRATPKAPDVALVALEAESTSSTPGDIGYLARYKKHFGVDITTTAVYTDSPSPRVVCTCFLDLPEFIDDGRGDSPVVWELGVYDSEDNLIAYCTLTKENKNGSTQFSHTVSLLW
jgi:hypothetical protein